MSARCGVKVGLKVQKRISFEWKGSWRLRLAGLGKEGREGRIPGGKAVHWLGCSSSSVFQPDFHGAIDHASSGIGEALAYEFASLILPSKGSLEPNSVQILRMSQ